MEWVDRGLRVNAISPGYTLTPMNRRPEVADQVKIFERDTPMERSGRARGYGRASGVFGQPRVVLRHRHRSDHRWRICVLVAVTSGSLNLCHKRIGNVGDQPLNLHSRPMVRRKAEMSEKVTLELLGLQMHTLIGEVRAMHSELSAMRAEIDGAFHMMRGTDSHVEGLRRIIDGRSQRISALERSK